MRDPNEFDFCSCLKVGQLIDSAIEYLDKQFEGECVSAWAIRIALVNELFLRKLQAGTVVKNGKVEDMSGLVEYAKGNAEKMMRDFSDYIDHKLGEQALENGEAVDLTGLNPEEGMQAIAEAIAGKSERAAGLANRVFQILDKLDSEDLPERAKKRLSFLRDKFTNVLKDGENQSLEKLQEMMADPEVDLSGTLVTIKPDGTTESVTEMDPVKFREKLQDLIDMATSTKH